MCLLVAERYEDVPLKNGCSKDSIVFENRFLFFWMSWKDEEESWNKFCLKCLSDPRSAAIFCFLLSLALVKWSWSNLSGYQRLCSYLLYIVQSVPPYGYLVQQYSMSFSFRSGKHLTSLGFDWQAMSFLNFGSEHDDSFRSKYLDVAKQFKCKGLSFLMGDFRASQGGFQVCAHQFPVWFTCYFSYISLLTRHIAGFYEQFFGLKEEQIPLIITQANNRKKYLKRNVEPDQIAAWFKDFTVKNPSSLLIGPSLHLSMEVSPRHWWSLYFFCTF